MESGTTASAQANKIHQVIVLQALTGIREASVRLSRIGRTAQEDLHPPGIGERDLAPHLPRLDRQGAGGQGAHGHAAFLEYRDRIASRLAIMVAVD
jgi:hypothetical protein